MAKAPSINVNLHATIEPGSKVLLTVDHQLTLDRAQTMKDALAERFPGVEFTFVEASGIAVMPPDALARKEDA